MTMGTEIDADSAFLDIAANTLAVVIIVTVFSLVVVHETVPATSDPDAVSEPALLFRAGERSPFPPLSRFIVFAEERAFTFDGDAAVEAILAKGSGPVVAETMHQGRMDFIPVPANAYDIDVYQFSFTPDLEFVASLPPFDHGASAAFVDAVEEAWKADGLAPTFVVYPGGMDAFAAAHEELVARAMPWRWSPVEAGQPMRLERTVLGFRSFTTYW